MSKHTPGPWVLEPGSQHRFPSVLIGKVQPRLTINAGGAPMSEHEANASLIAAAPELLEALKTAHAHIADDVLRASIGNLIAKATGGQQ